MDVRFCERRDHSREAPNARAKDLDQKSARSRERARPRVFFLDRRLTWMSVRRPQRVGRSHSISKLRSTELLEFGEFGTGLHHQGQITIGIFPDGKQICVCGFGFRWISRPCVRARELEAGNGVERIDHE